MINLVQLLGGQPHELSNKHLQRACDTINHIPETKRWNLVRDQLELLTWKTRSHFGGNCKWHAN